MGDRVRSLARRGETVGVIDETGSLFYLASGSPPFGRLTRILTTPYNKELLDQAVAPYRRNPPDYVLTRSPTPADDPDPAGLTGFGAGPRPDSPYFDAWEAFAGVVHERYVLETRVGFFELWRLSSSRP
jgi:hypothetical protein